MIRGRGNSPPTFMNILVIIPPKFAGCGFYRLYQPHNHLAKNYQDVKVTMASGLRKNNISAYTDEELKEFDLIIWHKTYFEISDIRKCRDLGIVTVADFDDHWVVNREHSLYDMYQREGIAAKLHRLLLSVDYVTCTTDRLADEIAKVNDAVEVLPNAVDPGYDGWKVDRVKEERFVFGYLGGPCHVRDVGLLRNVQHELTEERSDYLIRLFGWNGTDIYNHYARVLSDNNRSGNFSLYKGADIWNYPKFYNMMDCSLVPLEDNRFNSMKSELKMVEAAHFSKAVIVSDVDPYSDVIKHKVNCLAVRRPDEWTKYCRMLLDNPNLAADLGAELNRTMKPFTMDVVNVKRYQFYTDVLKN